MNGISIFFFLNRALSHFACNSHSPEFLLTIQEVGCDFNTVDVAKRTCMHYACQFNNEFAVKWLWGQGIPIDKVDKMGYSPLMFACQKGNVDIINFLIENGADRKRIFQNSKTKKTYLNSSKSMIHFACESGNLDAIKIFADDDVNSLCWEGTPLNIVVRSNSIDATKYLLEKGADPNIGSELHEFPILNAAGNGNVEILKALVESGASVKVMCGKTTALDLAFKGNFTDCVIYLVSKDAETKELNRPPLIFVAMNQNYELLMNLLSINEKLISQKDFEGNNVFHFLGYNQAIDVMNFLLPKYKPQDIPNKIGLTPLGLAALNNKEESVRFFIKNGCNPNNRDAKDF